MRPSRGVLVVRGAVYGLVVVLGLIVWQLRENHEAPADQSPRGIETLHGRVFNAHAGEARAVLRDGEVTQVVLQLAEICPGDGRGAAMRFEDTGNNFGRDGRRFSASRSVDYLVEANGWQPRVTVEVQGELQKDRGAVRGTATSSVAWRRNGVAGATCGPKTVRWEALKPKG